MSEPEAALLGLIHGLGAVSEAELRAIAGPNAKRMLSRLDAGGFVKGGHWSRVNGRDLPEHGEWRYALTDEGVYAFRVAVGRTCDWCDREATGGGRVHKTAGSIYWCSRHSQQGFAATHEGKPASKGSLYGLIRGGKLRTVEPDGEVTA